MRVAERLQKLALDLTSVAYDCENCDIIRAMKQQDLRQRIAEICTRLDEISSKDKPIIQPTPADEPVVLSLQDLEAYAARFDERQKLYAELRALASEPIEN